MAPWGFDSSLMRFFEGGGGDGLVSFEGKQKYIERGERRERARERGEGERKREKEKEREMVQGYLLDDLVHSV